MKEYRVQGLSCSSCAQRLESEIRRLEHGGDAKLSYNTGILSIGDGVSMEAVQRILRSDGARIAAEPSSAGPARQIAGEEARGRSGGRESAETRAQAFVLRWPLGRVILAAALYAAALIADWSAGPDRLVVPLLAAAMALSGYETFWRGLRYLVRFRFTMDTLMTVALIGAVAIGEWKEAALVAILFGVNEWLEGIGMERARRSMEKLLNAAPKTALKLEDGRETAVPVEELREGDVVLVRPGDQIPSDGIVTVGASSVNEAAVTGEGMPVDKKPGEPVYGGSLNNEGLLEVRLTKAYRDSSLAKIIHLVREAQETKTPTELFIQRFAKYYTPAVMAIALLVALLPPLLLGGEWKTWLYQGLSVLIVGCPCALILASPIAIVSGIARLARHGILVKGGVHLEELGKIDTLAFDKTGTLTKGRPRVAKMISFDDSFLTVAGSMEQSSSHPLAKAVMETVRERNAALIKPESIRSLPGKGAEAVIGGRLYRLGNESAAADAEMTDDTKRTIREWKQEGLTLVIASDEKKVLGLFGIEDEIREESAPVIAELGRIGIRRTVMLTGDHERTAAKVASATGVTAYEAGLLPEDKVNKVKELAASGRTAMIGDGLNDAPALASARLGIAMGKGTDSAIETADIVLMQDHLGKLPEAVRTAKRVNRLIRFNISTALGLKAVALLLTIPGWLTLWIAILSDMGATVFVTLTGMSLLLERKPRPERRTPAEG